MSTPRFTIEPADGWTECDCPESLCPHDDPQGMRPYRAWTVWDNERNEHAFITCGNAFDVEYERKRDAKADLDRYLDSLTAVEA